MSWWCFGLRNLGAHVGAVDYVRRQGRFCRLDRFLHALRRPDHRPAPGAGAVQAPVPSVFLEPGDSGSVAGAFAAMLMVGCLENIFGVLAVAFSAIEYWLPLATSSCQDAAQGSVVSAVGSLRLPCACCCMASVCFTEVLSSRQAGDRLVRKLDFEFSRQPNLQWLEWTGDWRCPGLRLPAPAFTRRRPRHSSLG